VSVLTVRNTTFTLQWQRKALNGRENPSDSEALNEFPLHLQQDACDSIVRPSKSTFNHQLISRASSYPVTLQDTNPNLQFGIEHCILF